MNTTDFEFQHDYLSDHDENVECFLKVWVEVSHLPNGEYNIESYEIKDEEIKLRDISELLKKFRNELFEDITKEVVDRAELHVQKLMEAA